jgi:hypothetical protein
MRIEVTMTFPPHVTLTEPVKVRFTAHVVRIESSPTYSGIGVAAMIEEYEFLRSIPRRKSLAKEDSEPVISNALSI